MNHEVTLACVCWEKVLLWLQFENVVTQLETYWLDEALYSRTVSGNLAKRRVWWAVKVRQVFGPLRLNSIKHIRWDRKLRASSVYYSWVSSIFTRFLHWLFAIKHALPFKSPSSKPIFKVFECFKTTCSTNDLSRVITTKKRIRRLAHILWSDAETHHRVFDYFTVFKRPQEM